MKTMQASEFMAKCLQVMDEVARSGEVVVITQKGKPLVRLVPHRSPAKTLWGLHAGSATMEDDLVVPTGEVWE